MMKRMGIAIVTWLFSLLVAAILFVAMGWKIALVAVAVGIFVAGILAVRALIKFNNSAFDDDFFKKNPLFGSAGNRHKH